MRGLPGCGWLDHEEVDRAASEVEGRLDSLGSPGPERPGFRSLTRSKDPYLAIRPVTDERSRLPADLRSETGVVVRRGNE